MKISLGRGIFFLLLSVALVFIDFLVKQYVIHHIPRLMISGQEYPYGGIGVFQGWLGGVDFSISHVVNRGGAWGLFASFYAVLLLLRIAVIIGLIIYLLGINQVRARQIPFALIISGAMANIFDCLKYGHVIDMFLFNFWGYIFPLFNVADSMIFLGVTMLFLHSCFASKKRQLT